MIHLHHCPECYEKYQCDMKCTIESDLEDQITFPGWQFGAHSVCDRCEGKKEQPSKEWFDRYNGFTR